MVEVPREWTSIAVTRDGQTFCIRPLRADDRERETAFVNGLSEQARYFRLFTPLKFLTPHLLDQLMDIDYRGRMAFVATAEPGGTEQFIGIARYAQTDVPGTVEFGITVMDAWQRRGIAKLLVSELMRFAYVQGFRRITGMVLPENRAMMALAESLGFTASYDSAEHLNHIVREIDAGQDAAGARGTPCPLRGTPG